MINCVHRLLRSPYSEVLGQRWLTVSIVCWEVLLAMAGAAMINWASFVCLFVDGRPWNIGTACQSGPWVPRWMQGNEEMMKWDSICEMTLTTKNEDSWVVGWMKLSEKEQWGEDEMLNCWGKTIIFWSRARLPLMQWHLTIDNLGRQGPRCQSFCVRDEELHWLVEEQLCATWRRKNEILLKIIHALIDANEHQPGPVCGLVRSCKIAWDALWWLQGHELFIL